MNYNKILENAAEKLLSGEYRKEMLSDKIEHCSPHVPMSEETVKMINKIAEEAYKTK